LIHEETKFLAKVMPLLGSPLDHRLNILCGDLSRWDRLRRAFTIGGRELGAAAAK
jgi:hypothetical protein